MTLSKTAFLQFPRGFGEHRGDDLTFWVTGGPVALERKGKESTATMAGSVFYNGILTIMWAALVLTTGLDWDDYDALGCAQPWQLFLIVDYALVMIMCAMVRAVHVGGGVVLVCADERRRAHDASLVYLRQDLVGSYCSTRDGYDRVLWIATRVAAVNYFCLMFWVVIGTWFLIAVRGRLGGGGGGGGGGGRACSELHGPALTKVTIAGLGLPRRSAER